MENKKVLDIIAYFLSKYNMDAFSSLGYSSQRKGFIEIAGAFGKKESYLRRLRDEYDVVTGSYRNGQCNRPPRQRIVDITKYLDKFSYNELLQLVQAFIDNSSQEMRDSDLMDGQTADMGNLKEEEMEYILNFKDPNAGIKEKYVLYKGRIYNTSIVKQLKILYQGKCQICGEQPFKEKNINISEVHHIRYFSLSCNNDIDNLIVLCPNHHRLIHKLNPEFDFEKKEFKYPDGTKEKVIIDYHLN